MGREGQSMELNDRGVALLIALLVTTLLMALIVEFAYGTRVSLRAAVNFRDSQRAYYLARSGVNVARKLLAEYRKPDPATNKERKFTNLEQREWQVVPVVSEGDTELRIRWEDESGKISIANVASGQQSLVRLERLFGLKNIDLAALDRIKELVAIRLPGELHRVMSDEEFDKMRDFVTVAPVSAVDVNTAPAEVLQSLGISAASASMIIEARGRDPFTDKSNLASSYGVDTTTLGMLDVTSDFFTVHAYATVGGYTKQAEAVVRRDTSEILYWKIL